MEQKKLVYCKRCVMPDTKPDLQLDGEGICNACRSFELRQKVDWDARKKELKEILSRFRSKNEERWDCIACKYADVVDK